MLRNVKTMRRQGMTLVETVIVLVITAIIGGIVLITYTYVSGRQLDANARTMVADLVWARERAVSLHQDTVVRFTKFQSYYSVYNGSIAPANLIKRQRCTLGISLYNVTDSNFNNLPNPPYVVFLAHTGIPQNNLNPFTRDTLVNLFQNYRLRRIRISGETGLVTIEQQ